MAASIFDLSGNPELKTLIEKEMTYAPLHEPRFGKWMAPNYVKATAGEVGSVGMKLPKWTGAPIEMRTAFIQEGRMDMLIPVRNRLSKPPVFGDMPLKGKGEAAQMAFRSVQINRTRKAYSKPTGMEAQKTKQWAKNFIGNAREDLKTHYSFWTGLNIPMTMYTGHSIDITMPVSAGGLGESYVSHPNFFVCGTAGQIGIDPATGTYVAGSTPGTAGYEAAVEAAINGLAGAPQQAVTAAFIQRIVSEAARKKIPQLVTSDGFQFYPIWLKDSAYFQLLRDPEFVKFAQTAVKSDSLAKHPLGNGMSTFYMGAAIYSDQSLFTAYTNADNANVTAGTIEYGARPSTAQLAEGWKFDPNIDTVDVGDNAIGILVGQSALTMGTGEDLKITEQNDDHGNIQEIGYDVIQSIVRNETYDTLGQITGTKGLFYQNTSSLVFASSSPYALG